MEYMPTPKDKRKVRNNSVEIIEINNNKALDIYYFSFLGNIPSKILRRFLSGCSNQSERQGTVLCLGLNYDFKKFSTIPFKVTVPRLVEG